ncbi:MAG: hypothetical protein Q8P41_13835 [Pseudomonadota bacterium]|nr:hypothetical protein [Pseudomonadota bacterium]
MPYEGSRARTHRPAYHTSDHRYAHPHPRHVRAYAPSGHRVPSHDWYRSWYTHWWVHPHYRWVHTTWVVVSFDFTPSPWEAGWAPPSRAGWAWVPGHWEGPYWVPGHWEPSRVAPSWYGAQWTWVPGFWVGPAYVEGYWRLQQRRDGEWVWVDGGYRSDGSYVPAHWRPATAPPAGFIWEAGFWDGESWVEGFWRPASRRNYDWVSARYLGDGTYEAGYWEPTEARPGYVWVPGWFDGEAWNDGYWVAEAEYRAADPDAWTPPEGVEDGWHDAPYEATDAPASEDELPLALPVDGVR